MSQQNSIINTILPVDEIKDAITERENSLWPENVGTLFPEGKREGEGVKNWVDGTTYSVFLFPSLDRITVKATAYALTQAGLY